ncbi:hypothetical protein VMCG_07292 [Cytospora schulzeri]|uniref:Uncharacterized protein n=1 Tax=Cytospora schulzeri TaxID=448051 RepID=A0A423WAP0_9PEZI|nr:hypothetical protein VMCG_07292 [Valsa malicola]
MATPSPKETTEGKKPHVYVNAYNPGLVTIEIDPNRLAQLNLNNPGTPTPTAATTMVGRSFVSDAATAGNSRAASADRTGDRVAMPTMAATHGAPTRQYLNSKVTYHVVEAMKIVAQERPADPLRVLGEFLLQRSKEVEGTTNGTDGEAAGDEATEADKNGDEQ